MLLEHNNNGYTFIEVVIVISVLLILMLSSMKMSAEPSKTLASERLCKNLKQVLLQYALENKGYPTNDRFKMLLVDNNFIIRYFPLGAPINPYTGDTSGLEIVLNKIYIKDKKGNLKYQEDLFEISLSTDSDYDGIGNVSPIIQYNF